MDRDKITEKLNEQVEEALECISEKGIQEDNIDDLGKLIDMHKDLANEKYWKEKEEYYMRYRGYGNDEYGRRDYRGRDMEEYGRGRARDSRGRYTGNHYGRRYRGHDAIDEMYDHYGNYSEAREEHRRGNYGAKDDTMKSLEYMMESVYDFVCMLHEDATSPEEIEVIKKYSRKISEL